MNQSKQLFSLQKHNKNKRFRTYHTKEQSIALRKQLLVWLFSNRYNQITYNDIYLKCDELKICRNLPYHLVNANIIIKNNHGTYDWNNEIKSPDYSKLVDDIGNAEKQLRKIMQENKIKKNKIIISNTNQFDFVIINQKLDLICKALGLC